MTKYLPAAAAATTGILVGAAIVATRFVIGQTGPATLALLRYLIGFGCLLPLLLLSERVLFARRDLLPIGLLGITQFGVVVMLLNYALQYIPSGRAALIFATLPLITMLLATVLGYERVTLIKALGVLATIVGVGLVLGEQAIRPMSSGDQWLAMLAVLASAACGALCSVLYRPYLQKYPTLAVSVFAMLASVLALALIAAGEGFWSAPPHFTAAGWLAVGFIGVSSGVGYYLWLWALNHSSATNVTVFLALSPVSATILGAVALAEIPSATTLFGLACGALGIWMAQ
ncbi:MAG: DMT family transporter [Roseiflexaceae bacterium]